MSFGEYMKQAMKEMNISQAELGRRIGVKRSTINGYVSGRRTKIALPILIYIIQTLNMDTVKVIHECKELKITDDPIPLPEPPPLIEDDEQQKKGHRKFQLMLEFDKLNEAGQQKVVEYIFDLSDNPKYTKSDEQGD